ncbi:MAG: PAS domain S-box protein [Deltaproteobacteria bacterium]|nr:PAS domain S-box protein [Deltaproteobacteria bacterium]
MPSDSDRLQPSAGNHRLFADQVQKQYEHTGFGTAATLINGMILAFVLRGHVRRMELIVWLVGAVMVSALRLVLNGLYRRSPTKTSNPQKWNAGFLATLFLSGVLWGSTAIFLFPSDSFAHQAFIAFVTGGMVAGAIGAFTAVLSAFYLFSIPALLPICFRFFMLGSDIHIAMGAMVLLFLLINILTATRMHKDILALLALRYERSALIADLQQEVDQRKAAQEDLRRQKEQVEAIVITRTDELARANQRLRAIITYAPLVIWAIDREGVLTFSDGKGMEKIGFTPGRAVGKSVFELFADNQPIIDITQRAISGEYISDTIHFKDVFFEVRIQPITDAGGRLTGAIGIALDVTEQTLAKEALRKSEEKFRDLVENINDVIYAVDRQGMVTYVSPVIESISGFRASELIGKNFFDYICPQDRARLKNDFARALEVIRGPEEYRFFDKSGETRWCRVSSRPVLEGDEITGIQGVLADVTWSKRLEEQLTRAQKMEALGTLAGGVAHDLNNILSGIVSYPELLLMDLPQDSPLRRPLATIKRSGENAAAIVQDLLTLSRRGVSTLELLNLNHIVTDCLESPEIQSMMRLHPTVHLSTHLQSDLFNIYGSSIHVFKSLSNLISNAVEAMPKGGRIEITTGNRYADSVVAGFDTVKEGEYVVLSIADSGIGIPESDRARIFEPFYTRKAMGRNGSGLGMAVVWGTIKDHHGYIDIHSEEGQGTRFDLFFPATRDQLQKSRKPETLSDFAGNGEFILVVDDIPVQREIATRILERLGYRCEAVASGEEAIEFLRTRTADLVVLDMIMAPGIDGYETYRQIRSIRPEQKAIIASGYSETERVREAQAMGAGSYIKKPYTLASIGKAIKEELQR